MNKAVRKFLVTYGVILSICVVSYLVRLASGEFSPEFNSILFFVSLFLLSVSWLLLSFVHRLLNKILPFEESIVLRITVQLAIGIALAFFIRFLIYEFGEPYLPLKLDPLFLASTRVLYALAVTGVNAVFFIKYFLSRWKESIVLTERLEKEKSQVQFDNLKNQLNPHFLFNALTSLNSLIFENQELASQFLQHMSKVYRYVLQNKDKNFVSLQTEIDFIKNYVFLAETRYGEALKIRFDIHKDTLERAIVPVTLQILIENAFKHNIIDHEKPLQIDIVTMGDYLVISNNLQVRRTVESSNKLGLENLKSLYAFLTERSVIIESLPERFNVKVPLI